ncbi:MAG: hypothetical protein ACJAVA_000331 [Flavobacteriaceae bacterium]|jgi:hypothetical protein
MNRYKTQEGLFFVEIVKPTKDQIESYYSNNNEFKSTGSSEDNPRVFKKAIIKNTFCVEKYPVDSEWMMGEVPGMKINFFGEKLIMIQEKDVYARIS